MTQPRHRSSVRVPRRAPRVPFLELLEDRTLLNHGIGHHVIAQFDGVLANPADTRQIDVNLIASDFTIQAGQTVFLGFLVRASAASPLDPAAVQVRTNGGTLVTPDVVRADLAGRTQSLVLADVRLGGYRLTVAGERGTAGAFQLDVFLAGDADGNRAANFVDRDLIHGLLGVTAGQGNYRTEADVDLDGRIDGYDNSLWARNHQNSTRVNPLGLTLGLGPRSLRLADGSLLTNVPASRVLGVTAPGARVTLERNGALVGTGTADLGGNYSIPIALTEGTNPILVRAADTFGQQRSATAVLKLDTRPPTARSSLTGTIHTTVSSFDIFYDEPMDASAFRTSNYALTVNGGPAHGQPLIISAVTQVTPSTARLELPLPLADQGYRLVISSAVGDLADNRVVEPRTFLFTIADAVGIKEISPAHGEGHVGLAREIIVRFDDRVDPLTVHATSFKVIANGQPLPGTIRVSATELFATFFPTNALPTSTGIRVAVEGIRGRDGLLVDGDGDTVPGGKAIADFRTLPLARIAGTHVFGYVYDSFNRLPGGADRPIVGATIRVDAFPGANAVTDANGYFELRDMPAPEFFVHIDGTTATNAPAGFGYPSVGKPFHSVPGQRVQLSMDGRPFNVYLPPMSMGDVLPLSSTQPTDVGFGAAGRAQLQALFPNVNPATWDRMRVTYPPNSAVTNQGVPATMGTVIPVAPTRIPAPLPPNLNPQLVVSIQAMDAQGREVTNFDVPAPVTFPNLEGLRAGEKSLIFSFNHDAGRWDVIGAGTVSADGLTVVSDPGVGVRAPGWHFVAVGTFADGSSCHENEMLDPRPPKLEVEDQDAMKGDKILYFNKPGVTQGIAVRNTGGMVLHVTSAGLTLSGDADKYFKVMAVDSCTVSGGQIKVESLDPMTTDNANWKMLEGPVVYAGKLTIMSDGGTEEIKLISFIDSGDDASDATLKVNTTTKDATRKVPLEKKGSEAGSVAFVAPSAPFGLAGSDLTYKPTDTSAAADKLAVQVGGNTVGEVPLAGQGFAVQPLHLNRADFLAKIRDFRKNDPAVTDPTNADYANYANFRTLFPDPNDTLVPPLVNTPFESLFADIARITDDLLRGDYAGLYSINNVAAGTGTVAKYDLGLSAVNPVFVGQALVDFPSKADFKTFADAENTRTTGQTYFQFREKFNNSLAGSLEVFLRLETRGFSTSVAVLATEIADTIVHETVHTLGAIHDETRGQLVVNPFGPLAGKMAKLGFHTEINAADTKSVYDHYKAKRQPGVSWKGDDTRAPVLAVNGSQSIAGLTLNFGAVAADGPGGATAPMIVQVDNINGTANLVLDNWSLTGPFTFVTAPANGLTVPPGSTRSFQITFDPTAVGTAVGQLRFTSNDDSQPTVTVALTGIGIDRNANIAVSAGALNFGAQTVGNGQETTRAVEVRNTGLQALTVTAIQFTEGVAAYRLVTPPALPFTLNPGQSRTLQVAFRPDALGLDQGELVFTSNDQDAPRTSVYLIGTGLNPQGNPTIFTGAYIGIQTQSGLVFHDRLKASGQFQFILPVNQRFALVLFDPVSGLVSHGNLVTGASGSTVSMKDLFFSSSVAVDSDGDGLPDDAEFAVGTSAARADTDNDGINDSAEIAQGLDPLDNRGFPTGIISSLPLRGEAKEITVEGSTLSPGGQTAYVATGSFGLAIVDASRFNNPIVLGQLDLPGDATDVAVDTSLGIAAVATGAGGLHLVNVADPMMPTLRQTINVAAGQVAIVQGVAYVTVGTSLRAYDLLTGELLQSLSLPGSTLTGLTREGTFLYTMDSGRRLRAIDTSGFNMVARGLLTLPHGGGKLFVGNGIAYAPAITSYFRGGFATANISNPDALTLISGSDVVSPFVEPGRAIAVNGSGIGVLVGTPDATSVHQVALMNVADPANTNNLLLRINLPSAPLGVALASGIAFVADGVSGLQVVNYLPFDNRGMAPTVTASTSVADVDPAAPGIQVFEGTSIPVRAVIADDVQVRNAELLVNGQVVRNDVSFPFDFFAVAPNLAPGADTVTIQVRATDTGGNTTLSNILTLGLVNDTFPPTVLSIEPPANFSQVEPRETVKVRFSKSMAAATLTTQTIRLRDSLGNFLTPTTFQTRNDDRFVQLTFAPLTLGNYEIVLSAAALTDRAGNALGTANIVSPFSLTARASVGTTAPDDDPAAPGLQVFEGTTLPLVVTVVPGVAVQRVEFLFNGVLIATDTTAPFTAAAVAPNIAPGVTSFTLQARVTDTANLATLTNLLTVGLLEDVTPPTATATNPPAGGSTFRGATSVQVIFSESMAVGSLAPAQFVLIGAGPGGLFDDGNDVPVAISAVQPLNDDTVAQLTVTPLPLGPHRLRVLGGGLTDRAGNVLVTEFTSEFDVLDFIPLTITFNAGSGFPLSYTESGLTVISRYPDHVHLGDQFFDGSPDLLNHDSCCSQPYEFFFAGGAPFTVVSLRVMSHFGTARFRVPGGPTLSVTGPGTINFPSNGWSNITSFFWDQPSGQTIIDDLMILARPGGAPLHGSRTAGGGPGPVVAIGLPEARALADEAAAFWARTLNLAEVPSFTLVLADLPGAQLGAALQLGNTRIVTLDPDANGVVWFVDPTPWEHSEFTGRPTPFAFAATAQSPAAHGYDLLTVLLHEIGHLVGFEGDHEHVDGHAHPFDLMNARLDPGIRKLPSDLDVRILDHDHADAVVVSASTPATWTGFPEALAQGTSPRPGLPSPRQEVSGTSRSGNRPVALSRLAPGELASLVLPSANYSVIRDSVQVRPITDSVDQVFAFPEWLAEHAYAARIERK